MNLAAHEEQCHCIKSKPKMVFKRIGVPVSSVGRIGRRNKWIGLHRQQLAKKQQQLNGFDLTSFVDSSKNFLTNLTGKAATTSNSVPPLLARPVQKAKVTTVNAPLPVATPSFLNTVTESIKQLTPSLVSVAQTKIAIDSQKNLLNTMSN